MANTNSKIIYIRRFPSFVHEANKEMESWLDEASRSIGSYFRGGSKKPGTGLTFEEEDLLMPTILNLPKEDREYRKQIDLYYTEITTKIPGGEGLPLEIGLKDNSKDLSADNLPLEIEDYIRYRHAISNPQVSKTKKDGEGNPLIHYYIFDPKENVKVAQEESDVEDKSLAKYLAIKDNKDIVDMLTTNLGITVDPKKKERSTPVLALKDYLTKGQDEAERFLKAANDKNAIPRYKIKKMVEAKILYNVGSRYLITETDEEIGGDLKEAIQWFIDSKNSKSVQVMTTRLKEFGKNVSIKVLDEEITLI